MLYLLPLEIRDSNGKLFEETAFKKHFLALCKKLKKNNQALCFAFLVYDFGNQNIKKIIDDPTYWSSLDAVSERFITLFYINSREEYYHSRQKEIEKLKKPNGANTTQPISTILDRAKNQIKEKFKIEDQLETPFLIFFQTEGNEIIDHFFVKLKEEFIEHSFIELKKHLENGKEALLKVESEYYNNHQEVFDLLKIGIKSGIFNNFIDKKIIANINISVIFSLLKKLNGIY